MNHRLQEIRHNPLLWLLASVPLVFAVQKPEAHMLFFVLSVPGFVLIAAMIGQAMAGPTGIKAFN